MENNRMKLFVVGETSGNPDDWSGRFLNRVLILAHNKDEAQALCSGIGGPAVEVYGIRPAIIADTSIC